MRKILFLLASLIFLLASVPTISQARNRIIDEVEIVKNPAGSEIHVFFNSFFQVTSHNPKKNGDFLQIELRPVSTSGLELTDMLVAENVVWAPTKDVPLLEITYVGESNYAESDFTDPANRLGAKDIQSQLKLRFKEQVGFTVNASADLRSVVVFIPKKKEIFTDIFAINLMSTPVRVAEKDVPPLPMFKEKQLYMAEAQVKGQTWYRWRLGFFPSKEKATEALPSLLKTFSDAWVVEVSQTERAENAVVEKVAEKEKVVEKEFEERKVRPLSPERLASMIEEAEKEMTAENYNRAIQLYSRILQHPDPVHQQKALEILGLARERKGQLAHAKALYEEYLAKYPQSDGSLRVQQRLTGMLTARSQPKESLRKARKALPDDQWEKQFFGSIAQSYQYDESETDGRRSENLNSLTSDADLNFRLRNENYDMQAIFRGSNENDFTEDSDDEARVSALNFDFLNRRNSLYGRIGRQSVNTGGILGRFDGLYAGYRLTPSIKVNGVFGYPVESSKITKVEKSKHFYGINFDLGTFADHWDYNLFFIEQEVDGITDRRAVGGELKYYDSKLSVFSLLDYDIFYEELNTFLIVGNWKASDKTTYNMQVDFKKSPLLMTSNALSGQLSETIEALNLLYTEEEINQFAEDRTAKTNSQLIGVTHDFSPHWQFYGDATRFYTDGTIASGGVDAFPGTGDEYFYNAQLIGNGLLKEGDLAIFGVRYSDLSNYNAALFSVNGRYPVTRDFRLNPRLRFEYREYDDGSRERTRFTPTLRLDYRLRKYIRLEFEGGAEFTRDNDNDIVSNTDRYYVILRYRFLF